MITAPRPGVVLLSGGLDSSTVLAIALAEGFGCHALSFRYGQRHDCEIDAATAAAARAGVPHRIIDIDLRAFGGSALTADIDVPKGRDLDTIAEEIPITYVPARNTVFLAYALAWAEVLEARDIFIGVNAIDYSGYPDCRPDYIEAFERMANLATKAAVEGARVRIRAPLIDWTKAEIIERGAALGVDYAATVSCYDPSADGRACGGCDACGIRAAGFRQAGLVDPTRYVDPD